MLSDLEKKKLEIEILKLQAEITKLQAESDKINKETLNYPNVTYYGLLAGLTGAVGVSLIQALFK